MVRLIEFIDYLLGLYIVIVFAMAVLSWLIAFNVVNTRNQAVYTIADILYRLTEPALRPIRRLLPNLGGIDVSPVILIIIIVFLRSVVLGTLHDYFSGAAAAGM
jgi:YggT family protein